MQIVFSICLVSIAAALFQMLVPENSFKKQLGLLISCFFLLSLISIFTDGKLALDVNASLENNTTYVDITQKVNDKAYQTIGKELSDRLKAKLAAEQIFPEQILVIVNIPNLYSISISEVELVFSAENAEVAQKAVEIVQGEVGDDIQVSHKIKDGD